MSNDKEKTTAAQDAQLLLQLYDLRREPVMRAARRFMVTEFWPKNLDEFRALMLNFGSEQNAWARQCLTYWDMAAAMVLRGALDEDIFFACNIEPYFLFAKFGPYLAEFRQHYVAPNFLSNLEELSNRPKSIERINDVKARLEARSKEAASKAAAKSS